MSDQDAGALAALDRHKLGLTLEDFRSIDSDSNNRLSLLELSSAAKSGKFSETKQTAVEHLRDELQKSPDQPVDRDHDSHKVIPSWHTAGFAMEQLSREDFKSIDADSNNVLSKDELNASKDKNDLTPMSKHAAQILLRETESDYSDDIRSIIHRNLVNNWHDLDPDFKNERTDSLAKLISLDSPRAIKAGNELVKRIDFALTPSEVNDSIQSIAILQEALKLNKDIGHKDGKPFLTDNPLSDERRLQMHAAILGDISTIDEQIRARTGMASVVEKGGNRADAQKWLADAVDRSDVLMNKVKTDNGEVRLIDLMKAEVTLLISDGTRTKSNEMLNAATRLNEIIRSPIETRRDDAIQSLSMSYSANYDGSIKVSVNTADPLFNPDKAEQRSKETRALLIDIVGVDPLASGKESSLFGGSWKEIDPMAKYNFYRDDNKNGKVDLLDKLREMKTYNESWKGSTFGKKTELR